MDKKETILAILKAGHELDVALNVALEGIRSKELEFSEDLFILFIEATRYSSIFSRYHKENQC